MKDRIYRGTVRIVLASIAIFSLIFAVGLYFVFTGHFQNQLRTELELLAGAMNAAEDPETLFALWSGEGAGTRLTLIAQDGTVLADTPARWRTTPRGPRSGRRSKRASARRAASRRPWMR